MRSPRLRKVLLLIAVVATAVFGFYRVMNEAPAGVEDVDPAFALPPSPIATPPRGAHPKAFFENARLLLETDGAAYVFLGIVLTAALLNVVDPREARRLRTSVLGFLGYLVTVPIASAFLASQSLPMYGHVRVIGVFLLGLAIVNALAIFALDIGLRAVRVAVPRILADVLVFVSYAALGLLVLTRAGINVSGLIATSAVLTAVIGLSLQDTLGNVMAGLVLEMEDTVNIGDWVKVGDVVGRVREIRWRQTTIETRNWDTIVVPNAVFMKSHVHVFGRRAGQPLQQRRWVYFSVGLDVVPSVVIDAVETALTVASIECVAQEPRPNCILTDWRDGAAIFAVRYWLTDIAVDDPTDSVIRERVYLALKRAGVRLAFPAHAVSMTEEDEERRAAREKEELARRLDALARVDLFKVLDAKELEEVAPHLRFAPFARGEVMTRQGAQAHWLYLIISGRATVSVARDGIDREVSELGQGDVFGEMALLTGEPRAATVLAKTPVECWRLDRTGFASVIQRRPEIAKELSRMLALRRASLDAAAQDMARDTGRLRRLGAVEQDILFKITAFFGLREKPDEAGTTAIR